MTNGEVLQKTFSNSESDIDALSTKVVFALEPRTNGQQLFVFDKDWWNAEYKEPTTKNDLTVDWESYKDADGNSLDYLILNVLQNNFDCGDAYGYTVADKIIGLLPSVTPQEPRRIHAKWEQLDNEPDTFFTTHQYGCSNCGKIQLAKSKNIKKYRYCSKCGADMREIEE